MPGEIDISVETLQIIKAAKQAREDARLAKENRKIQHAEANAADVETLQKTTMSEDLAHKALDALTAELAPEPDNPPSPTPPPPAPTPEPTPPPPSGPVVTPENLPSPGGSPGGESGPFGR
jgi:hypothetical protein